jgi:DeoR/GlpR family transcriptional regulator of sugar metabolism
VSFCLTGPRTEDEARRYHIDMAFLSTKGFPPDHGMFESSAPTYRIKQIMAQQSSKVVLMVDHTKFNQRALFNVLSVEQIDTVITDQGISESDLKLLKNNVKNVHVVSLTPTS